MLTNTIEDCLEILAGFRKESNGFSLMKEDYTIMHSIAKQVFKGTALTDRQFALMQTKLLSYKDQFDKADIPLEIKKIRKPLREINREKYIRLEGDKIKIRFPFKKSDIMLINEISHKSQGYKHNKGSHEHFFDFTEQNVLNLLDRFSSKSFKCDKEIFLVYHEMKHMEQLKHVYVPGIYDMKIKNVKENLLVLIKKDLGELTAQTFLKYCDRKLKYGLEHIDGISAPSNIKESIAFRKMQAYQSKPSEQPLNSLLESLWDLDRFPILAVLSKNNAEEQLHAMINYYRDIMNVDQQSVLFRLDDKNAGFNQLVKDRKLNNWVDKLTKVVYISKDKLPKILINCEWKPSVAICFDSVLGKEVNTFVSSKCDLIIFREEYTSPFRRHSNIYG